MASFLSHAELLAMQDLPRNTPYVIENVSKGIMSIARHYGGCVYMGAEYAYIQESDELIRRDVLAKVNKMRKPSRKKAAAAKYPALF